MVRSNTDGSRVLDWGWEVAFSEAAIGSKARLKSCLEIVGFAREYPFRDLCMIDIAWSWSIESSIGESDHLILLHSLLSRERAIDFICIVMQMDSLSNWFGGNVCSNRWPIIKSSCKWLGRAGSVGSMSSCYQLVLVLRWGEDCAYEMALAV
jgi:hypothetical protein